MNLQIIFFSFFLSFLFASNGAIFNLIPMCFLVKHITAGLLSKQLPRAPDTQGPQRPHVVYVTIILWLCDLLQRCLVKCTTKFKEP